MPQIGSWNKHTFEISENLIRGFTDMTIKGGCEVTEKNSKQQKYVERKYGEIPSITITVELNAMVGVTDVMGESLAFVQEATDGATDYFYLGSRKLLPCKVRLTEAEIVEISHMPGKGDVWISSKVKLTMKQGTETDGGGGGSSPGSKKSSVTKTTPTAAETAAKIISTVGEAAKTAVTTGINAVKTLIENAKANSAKAKNNEIDAMTSAAPVSSDRVSQINKDSANKVTATTGRAAAAVATAKKLAQKAANNKANLAK